jgi:hypothetical protein
MKRLIAVLMLFGLMAGCSGIPITDDVNNQAIAYAAGKGIGFAINKYAPKADPKLSEAWAHMMTSNAGTDPVPAAAIMGFYQESILLLSAEVKDPYGLISDLTFFLSLYGGAVVNGQLTLAKDVPLIVMKAFELGYKSGKSAVRSYSAP